MNLKQRLEKQLLEAMKSKNESQKIAIRTTLSSIKLAEIEKGMPLDDLAVISIIQKEIKIRKESLADAQHNAREDLAAQATAELLVLETMLPDQLTETDLRSMIDQVITELNATSITDTSMVMKTIIPKIAGRAPNDLVSRIVKEYLTRPQ